MPSGRPIFALNSAVVTNSGPRSLDAGPGGYLWFTEQGTSKVAKINTSGVITEYATPTPNAVPARMTAGPDGDMWFTENGASKVGRINPSTGAITEFTIPTPSSFPVGITPGPDGNV